MNVSMVSKGLGLLVECTDAQRRDLPLSLTHGSVDAWDQCKVCRRGYEAQDLEQRGAERGQDPGPGAAEAKERTRPGTCTWSRGGQKGDKARNLEQRVQRGDEAQDLDLEPRRAERK